MKLFHVFADTCDKKIVNYSLLKDEKVSMSDETIFIHEIIEF